MLPNSPAYILSTTGALGAGVIVTTINPSYTPHEVARQIKMSKAKAILSNVALLPIVNEAIQLLGKLDVYLPKDARSIKSLFSNFRF